MGKRSQKSSVLMVCVGNLCRSPIAEAVMRDVVARAGLQGEWHVESAGIEDWHSGRRPDERALNVLARHNIDYHGKARVLAPEDFFEFDYIFGMDLSNLAALRRMAPKGATAKLLILGNFGLKPDERIIEDPYYDISEAPFEQIYRQCSIACKNFLKQARLKQIM
ncbi:low molecular weight phosphotyrosine protein phosphatase 2 [Drosophila sechellia]|uniref:Low molecular weight phosphotyrosine protein phosphatase n=1 Tax=Drosophila sechellia TaxID=7238 RepID=B4HFP0_DROSE|nr:low molecular weight phosphotyrosine protein phosphatase 2 [Drosophila sechellia]EDW42275.1 GM25908 [Drosophila sechellia]